MNMELLKKQLDIHADAFYDFADKICTLSTGAPALSITFRKDIVGSSPAALWLLKVSWAAFVIALLCSTFYRFSKAKVHWEIAQSILNGQSLHIVSPGRLFSLCFRAGCLAFIAGVGTLVYFAALNI